MASQVRINLECLLNGHSRLVFTLAPVTLVRIGPDLDTALNGLISSLTATLNEKGNKPRHFATTYSLANITILLDCFEPGEDIHLQLLQLRLRSGTLTAHTLKDTKLLGRIDDQLKAIHKYQPKLEVPFRCVEDWRGYGPRDHPIYTQMVNASTSQDVWQEFKAAVSTLNQRLL